MDLFWLAFEFINLWLNNIFIDENIVCLIKLDFFDTLNLILDKHVKNILYCKISNIVYYNILIFYLIICKF